MHTEAVSAEKCKLVKESLFDFLTSQVPNADLDAVDDVIVSYVYTAIEAVDTAPEDFLAHVTDFVEIMSAYVKDFDKIDAQDVYVWLMGVISKLTEKPPHMDEAAKPDKPKESMKDSFSFQIPIDSPTKSGPKSKSSSCSSSRSNSTSEDDMKFPNSFSTNPRRGRELFESALKMRQIKYEEACVEPYNDIVSFLEDVFPAASHLEVKHCVSIAVGDVERAMATLLHRQEHGQSINQGTLPARNTRLTTYNAMEIKNRIIARYSYVDRESENREHKPLAPKQEAKKLVRYRDNKIVSMKGERFTDVSKGEEEGTKKNNKKHHP